MRGGDNEGEFVMRDGCIVASGLWRPPRYASARFLEQKLLGYVGYILVDDKSKASYRPRRWCANHAGTQRLGQMPPNKRSLSSVIFVLDGFSWSGPHWTINAGLKYGSNTKKTWKGDHTLLLKLVLCKGWRRGRSRSQHNFSVYLGEILPSHGITKYQGQYVLFTSVG